MRRTCQEKRVKSVKTVKIAMTTRRMVYYLLHVFILSFPFFCVRYRDDVLITLIIVVKQAALDVIKVVEAGGMHEIDSESVLLEISIPSKSDLDIKDLNLEWNGPVFGNSTDFYVYKYQIMESVSVVTFKLMLRSWIKKLTKLDENKGETTDFSSAIIIDKSIRLLGLVGGCYIGINIARSKSVGVINSMTTIAATSWLGKCISCVYLFVFICMCLSVSVCVCCFL